ncbi:hypothetical protein C5Y41_23975 [Rahnella variigena]|uniref:hypothetical protein n=1 Tax=Rahnella variigena TaxID=574964 RepID=UPI00101CA1B0|nr:hypothetical protein [Rahnella variigena]RYJ12530.1 hypothetical protein C5Y41_23975 [Rahnella variigena]
MSSQPTDYRPKIISFSDTTTTVSFAARQDILWPCHAWTLSLPHKKNRVLNVFEELILNLMAVSSTEAAHLADLTCLEVELVTFIQQRLHQLNLLDTCQQLTPRAHKLLAEQHDPHGGEVEYRVAWVLVDALNGELMEWITTEQPVFKKVEHWDGGENLRFLQRQTDKNAIHAIRIWPRGAVAHAEKPSVNKVLRAMRGFARRHKDLRYLNPQVELPFSSLPEAEAIQISDSAELVFLHCSALIRKGSGNVIVTDGFGFGFNDALARYCVSQSMPWITGLKKRARVERIPEQRADHIRAAYTHAQSIGKYHQVARRLAVAKSLIVRSERLHADPDGNEERLMQNVGDTAIGLYEAFEWSLRILLTQYPADRWQKLFSMQRPVQNQSILVGFAQDLGLNFPGSAAGMLRVKSGKFRTLHDNNVELQPLLALVIAAAHERPRHPLRALARQEPDWIEFLLQLKIRRDQAMHGKSQMLRLDIENLQMWLKRTETAILTLFPDFSPEESATDTATSEDFNQQFLVASLALDDALGISVAHTLDRMLRNALIQMIQLTTPPLDPLQTEAAFRTCIATVIELALAHVSKGYRQTALIQGELKSVALQRMVDAGFASSVSELPTPVVTVANEKVQQAVLGSGPTLGANLLGMFILAPEKELKALFHRDGDFIHFVASLALLRGHGNEAPASLISAAEMDQLQQRVLTTLNLMMEIF